MSMTVQDKQTNLELILISVVLFFSYPFFEICHRQRYTSCSNNVPLQVKVMSHQKNIFRNDFLSSTNYLSGLPCLRRCGTVSWLIYCVLIVKVEKLSRLVHNNLYRSTV